MIKHFYLLPLQALFDSLLSAIILIIVLSLPQSKEEISAFSISIVAFVLMSRFVSFEIPIRAFIAAKRCQLFNGTRGLIEYFFCGIILWIICQSIFWSFLFGKMSYVPVVGAFPISCHLAVSIGTLIFPLLFRKSKFWDQQRGERKAE